MSPGDAVFCADGAYLGSVTGADDVMLVAKGEGHTYKIPRDQVAYQHESRLFLRAPNRAAAHLWRADARQAAGLMGWWHRRVLGPSPRPLGGPLED